MSSIDTHFQLQSILANIVPVSKQFFRRGRWRGGPSFCRNLRLFVLSYFDHLSAHVFDERAQQNPGCRGLVKACRGASSHRAKRSRSRHCMDVFMEPVDGDLAPLERSRVKFHLRHPRIVLDALKPRSVVRISGQQGRHESSCFSIMKAVRESHLGHQAYTG